MSRVAHLARSRLVSPSFDDGEAVRRDRQPRADLAVGPLYPDLGLVRRAETDVDPAELAATVTTADSHLAPLNTVADLDLDP